MTDWAEKLRAWKPTDPPIRGPGRPKRGDYRDDDGQRVQSVTTIIDAMESKPGLEAWRMRHAFEQGYEYGALHDGPEPPGPRDVREARERAARKGFRPDQIRDEAGFIGSVVHDAIEEHLHGGNGLDVIGASDLRAEQTKQAMKAWGAFNRYVERIAHLRIVGTEIPLVSTDLGVGGTIDCVAWDCDRWWILDWKTSSSFRTSHVWQIGGYAEILQDVTGIECDDASIARFDKKTGRWATMDLGGNVLDQARRGFRGRVREMRRARAIERVFSSQINPPRRGTK